MLLAFIIAAFGSPRSVLASRVLAALSVLCPCAPADIACPDRHALAARVIATVAESDEDAAALLGLGTHESRFVATRQANGGPARSWWQVEPRGRGEARKEDAVRLEAEPLYAAQRALEAWAHGSSAYACGSARRCPDAAAELRRYVERARWALTAQ